MTVTDPIADLLTRIRNALMARKSFTLVPYSRLGLAIAQLLKGQGYITSVSEVTPGRMSAAKQLKIVLKYVNSQPVISHIRRVSRPGQRIYVSIPQLKSVLRGAGIAVLSTSSGLLTDKQAREKNLGGEILFKVW